MNVKPSRFELAIERFDQINAEDPRNERADGNGESGSTLPKELLYARRMSEWLDRFEPAASEELRLAARAQHIARWRIPRADYPEGRRGYKQWRARLMVHHADIAAEVMTQVGYGPEVIDKVTRLIRKQGLGRDPQVQALEDVVCLVFLEHYFDPFAANHTDEKLVHILRKTLAKMSDRARAKALSLDLGERAQRLLALALAE